MGIYFRGIIILLSVMLLGVGIKAKFDCRKKIVSKYLKDREKYLNCLSILYIITAIIWIATAIFNVFSIYPFTIFLLLVFLIENKYGRIKKKKTA
ncbi:MAG: hypothetical protein ACRC6T_14795 [Sarcina sp.]